jgi:hypothetical protein
VQVCDVAFCQGDDVHAGERQTFEQPGGVFLVATESVECFGKDDVELLPQRRGHEGLEAWSHQGRARYRVVRILALDAPALTLREFAAGAELISDRRVPLVL